MQASNKAIDLIKEFEKLNSTDAKKLYKEELESILKYLNITLSELNWAPKVYYCPAGKPTIGYGHVITGSLEPELLTKIITKEDAEKLLEEDLKYFVGYLNEVCKEYQVTLTQNQFDALCSFCFNLGSFKDAMLERFKNKDIKAIGNSITLYNKVNGKESNGLLNRRKAEQKLFFS